MATDMIARAMAAEAGSTEGVKNALTDTTAPEWAPAEQLAARQRLGMDKEWVLVGTIAGDEDNRGNIDTGVDVDLSGYTELYFIGRAIATGSTSITSNGGYLIYDPITSNRQFFVASFKDSYFGFECLYVKVRNSYTATSAADNGTGYTAVDDRKISQLTKIYFAAPEVVTKCDVKIYAR